MASVLIKNIGAMVSGELSQPLLQANSLYIEDGVIKEIGTTRTDADTVINANGLTVTPGLIDAHSHPMFADFTPVTNSIGWIRAYLHGGTTTIVSAGEQHIPGLPYDPADPQVLKQQAIVARSCWSNFRPSGVKVRGGTMLMVPGLSEGDFDDLARAGCTHCAKFIFYPYHRDWDEGKRYIQWCRERGIVTKVHSGGVSRSGVSQPAFAREVLQLRPDVVGHITGGPIAMPAEDMEAIIAETDCWLEVVSGANYRRNVEFYEMVQRHNAWHRVILGTDTPSGAGVMPRGMLRNLLFISGVAGVKPEEAICMATGNVAKAHHLQEGVIAVGRPADLVIMGKVFGTVGRDALESIAQGDLPGISCVLIDGKLVVRERSEQTPPPDRVAIVEKGG